LGCEKNTLKEIYVALELVGVENEKSIAAAKAMAVPERSIEKLK